ncbi:hypothetical protein [Parasphingorhabdus halotolerans]|uniref:Uncharacterized protein n=1 Tax=Parasphingorhabdus halotolerans TaxID=2725558 RepID=A0A6H2DJ70_9SPHN|nr:hypothetical protein [Parasphingorhabdus halotolerans]QJB68187.1 hypothetical protein HF685_01770 [Parasphingorhabdus halotolerans]
MKNLSEHRANERSRILRNARFLRDSLKPSNLLDRATQNTRKNASEVGYKIAATAQENKAILAAVGGTLVAALLYQPLRFLISRRKDAVDDTSASVDEEDTEEVTTED